MNASLTPKRGKRASSSSLRCTENLSQVRMLRQRFISSGSDTLVSIFFLGDTTNNFARHLDELFRTSDADDQPSWQRVTEFLQTYPQVIDVTIPVQCLVEDKSKLTLYEGSKAELAGFFNPTPHLEEDKHLLVRYLYQGSTHQVMVADEEAVKLPKSSHKVRR